MFCKHTWKILFKTKEDSAVEYVDGDPYRVQRVTLLLVCGVCGKLKKQELDGVEAV